MGYRQLQDSGGRVTGLDKIATIADGGTGADNRIDAIANLGAVPVEQLDAANGVGRLQNNARFPLEYFSELGMTASVAIVGPTSIVKGKTVEYFISNLDIALNNTVGVTGDGVTADLVDNTITVVVPGAYAGNDITLTVNNKAYVIPTITESIVKPTILSPIQHERVASSGVRIFGDRFKTPNELPYVWVPCLANQKTIIEVPEDAVGVAVRGHRPADGFLDVFVANEKSRLSSSFSILKRYFNDEKTFTISAGLDSFCEYAFIYPTLTHIGTDWQISYNLDFSSPIVNSSYDTVNLRKLLAVISTGVLPDRDLHIRCRYRTATYSSPWSDTVIARVNTAGTKYTYLDHTLTLPFNNQTDHYFTTTAGASISTKPRAFTGDQATKLDTLVAVGVPSGSLKSLQNAGVVLLYGFCDVARLNTPVADENRSYHINTITAPDGVGVGDFGRCVLFHNDLLFVSDPVRQKIYVYQDQADSQADFVLVQTITGPVGSESWGNALAAYDDVLLVGRPVSAGSGNVYTYRRVNEQYVYSTVIAAEEAGQWFGTAITVIDGGNLFAVSANAYLPGAAAEGRIDFYRETSEGVFNRLYTLKAPSGYGAGVTSNMFGYKIEYNAEQDRLYATAPNAVRSGSRSMILSFVKNGSDQFANTEFEYYSDIHYASIYDATYFGFGGLAFSPSDSVMFTGHLWKNDGIGVINVFERWLND